MKKILVVDDDFIQLDLYVDLFKDKGYEVLSAIDGLEGLEKALKANPDLVFTGIIMPRMDGFALVRNLRSNIQTAKIPVIMFSHLGREEDREKAKQMEGVEFMVKGFDSPADIAKKVDKILKEAETKPETKEKA